MVLRKISLHAEPGVNILLGPNGAGKTTLLRLLVGELKPSGGRLLSDEGAEVRPRSRARMAKVGWMPQQLNLPSRMRLLDFVTYAGWLKGLRWSTARANALECLDLVNLADRSDDRIGQLSGGMLRRSALAAAIVHKPELLLLDEPLVGLDPEQRVEMREMIRDQGVSTCVIMATHILQDLALLGDEIVLIADGQVRFSGPRDDFADLGGPSRDLEAAYAEALKGRDSTAA